jgi:hypothetical protein
MILTIQFTYKESRQCTGVAQMFSKVLDSFNIPGRIVTVQLVAGSRVVFFLTLHVPYIQDAAMREKWTQEGILARFLGALRPRIVRTPPPIRKGIQMLDEGHHPLLVFGQIQDLSRPRIIKAGVVKVPVVPKRVILANSRLDPRLPRTINIKP